VRYDLGQGSFGEGWRRIVAAMDRGSATGEFACRTCERKALCGYCPGFFELKLDRKPCIQSICARSAGNGSGGCARPDTGERQDEIREEKRERQARLPQARVRVIELGRQEVLGVGADRHLWPDMGNPTCSLGNCALNDIS